MSVCISTSGWGNVIAFTRIEIQPAAPLQVNARFAPINGDAGELAPVTTGVPVQVYLTIVRISVAREDRLVVSH